MNKKILCILTTYKREEKFIRFLRQFDERFLSVNSYFEIFIADDDPSSDTKSAIDKILPELGVRVNYKKNKINLGQGLNQLEAAKINSQYQYFWFPGDDDLIIANEFISILEQINKIEPTITAFEFKQGVGLSSGTNLDGVSRVENDINKIIFYLNNFGKCTSSIIKNPGIKFLDYMSDEFKKSMYQDKNMGVYSILCDPSPTAYIHTRLTAYGDSDYGLLRYSTRVFKNLEIGTRKVVDYYNSNNLNKKVIQVKKSKSAVYWWWFGIKATLNPRSEIRYTRKRFLKEIFFGLFFALYYDSLNEFQPN